MNLNRDQLALLKVWVNNAIDLKIEQNDRRDAYIEYTYEQDSWDAFVQAIYKESNHD